MSSKELDEQVKADISYIYDFAKSINNKAKNILDKYFEETDMNEKIRIAKRIHEISKKLEKINFVWLDYSKAIKV